MDEENVDMPDGRQYLIVQGDPYLLYNRIEKKYQIAVEESIFRYDDNGETFKDCFNNTIILDYDASDKVVFEYKLKGRIEPDFPDHPE